MSAAPWAPRPDAHPKPKGQIRSVGFRRAEPQRRASAPVGKLYEFQEPGR